ncbi:acyl-CoA dehydrogenase family protein [Pseudonocardia sp. WMMC193]|uniref:acyl-CoA dehydrogenase family protein n=1 Tax=Pseudonocardia sp. WMMC193 TaxID=2911965 RepID=UPI001F2F7E81|nr:acyl-CoA dehydrogenase family protein [Pseudonocardia sp. WMMC193]MCF7549925.1 acyl-CoA/acyl-ACP dehydrogenase [Pseudonocardia sp. WMMC193]
MDFAYDAEQDQFRASIRSFLTDHADPRAADGHDGPLWQRLCTDFGAAGLHAPEEHGGGGFTLVETALVLEELGRALAPVPAWGTVAAAEAVLRLGGADVRKEVLPPLLAGERIGALALVTEADLDPARVPVRADGGTLTGTVPVVPNGHVADVLVVPALVGDRVVLHVVTEFEAERQDSLDLTRPVAAVRLTDAPGTPLDEGDLDRLLDVLRVLLAAELLGTAGACLDAVVEYANTRVQFNRPIGSFQAVKHRCAELAVELDAARAAVMFAALAAAEDSPELATAAPVAKFQAADTAVACAAASIQIHGGIGFTWEHDAHLFYRRALTGAALLGSSARQREVLASRLGF